MITPISNPSMAPKLPDTRPKTLTLLPCIQVLLAAGFAFEVVVVVPSGSCSLAASLWLNQPTDLIKMGMYEASMTV